MCLATAAADGPIAYSPAHVVAVGRGMPGTGDGRAVRMRMVGGAALCVLFPNPDAVALYLVVGEWDV